MWLDIISGSVWEGVWVTRLAQESVDSVRQMALPNVGGHDPLPLRP